MTRCKIYTVNVCVSVSILLLALLYAVVENNRIDVNMFLIRKIDFSCILKKKDN